MCGKKRWLARVGQIGLVLVSLSLLIFCLLAPGSDALESPQSSQRPPASDAGQADLPAVLFLVVPPGFLALLALGMIWMIRPAPQRH